MRKMDKKSWLTGFVLGLCGKALPIAGSGREPVAYLYNYQDFNIDGGSFGNHVAGSLPLSFEHDISGSAASSEPLMHMVLPNMPQSGEIEIIYYFPIITFPGLSVGYTLKSHVVQIYGEPIELGTTITMTGASYNTDTESCNVSKWWTAVAGVLEDESETCELIYSDGVPVGMRIRGKLARPMTDITIRSYATFDERVAGYTGKWEFTNNNPIVLKVYEE